MLQYLLAAALAVPAMAISAATTLRTTQTQYCVPPSDIFVNAFSATYHKANQSIVFYVSLDTTQSGADVTARARVDAYDMELISQEIDLCQLVGGVLCPLPSLNISTYGTYQLNDVDIPALAWTVPDLEAYARIELVRSDGTDALCIEAPLTNGLTAGHPAVGYATGIFTGVALIIGVIHSIFNTASPAQYRWLDILFLYQYAVGLGMLNLDYPTVWRSFTKQLFWSFGLFSSTKMQESINQMRYKTGGSRSGSIVNTAYFIPSPEDYASYSNFNTILARLQALAAALSGGGFGGLFKRGILPDGEAAITSSVIANNEDLVQQNGLAVYTNSIQVPYTNALTTAFFFFLAFIGIFLVVHAIVFIITLLVARGRHYGAIDFKRRFGLWTAGNLLLVCLMWFFPLWVLGFYQFRIGDSKLAIFWAVLGLVLTFIPLAIVFFLSILRHRRYSSTSPGVSPLYTSYKWFHSAGHVYRAYRPKFHWFWFLLALAMIARAGFVAFGTTNGWAQVIGLMVVEVIVLIALLVCRPHKDKKGDWLAPILSFLRLAMAGLLIAFIPSVGVAGIPKAVIGFVLIAIVGILTIVLFIGLIINAGYGWLWRRHTDRIEDGFEVERDRYIGADGKTGARGAHMRERDEAGILGAGRTGGRFRNKHLSHVESPDSNRTSADLIGAGNGNRQSSIMDPVGDNVYDTTNGNGYGTADHNAYVRDGRDAEFGNGGAGNGYGSRPGSGLRSHTPSYRRSQYGGSVRGANGAGVGAGRY